METIISTLEKIREISIHKSEKMTITKTTKSSNKAEWISIVDMKSEDKIPALSKEY